MGKSSSPAPYVPPPQPDPEAVAQAQRAQNLDITAIQTDVASQTANLARMFGGGMLQPSGALATGSLNGAPSLGLAPFGISSTGSFALGTGR